MAEADNALEPAQVDLKTTIIDFFSVWNRLQDQSSWRRLVQTVVQIDCQSYV